MQILKVEAAEGGAALVTARLKERGDLWAAMGKRSNDASYNNPYVVVCHVWLKVLFNCSSRASAGC